MPFREDADRPPDIARSTAQLPGFRPRKLGHVNFLTGRIRGAERASTPRCWA